MLYAFHFIAAFVEYISCDVYRHVCRFPAPLSLSGLKEEAASLFAEQMLPEPGKETGWLCALAAGLCMLCAAVSARDGPQILYNDMNNE